MHFYEIRTRIRSFRVFSKVKLNIFLSLCSYEITQYKLHSILKYFQIKHKL